MRTGPRLALLALAGVLALFLIACGEDDSGGGAATKDGGALLGRALANPPDGGEARVKISLDLDGIEALDGPAVLTMKGPFESRGEAKLPKADWDLSLNAGGLALQAGLKLTGDKVYLEFQGDAYELGGLLAELPKDSSKDGGAGFLAGLGLDPRSWLDDPKLEDGQDIGGDSTRRVTGSVDVKNLVRDLLSALSSPELKRKLGARGELLPRELSEQDTEKLREAIKDFSFEANVDDADVLRRLLVKARFAVPSDAGIGGLEGGDVSIDYVLEKVGGRVDVRPPRNAQPLGDLLRQFGLPNPLGPTRQ